ncbi:helix-turn-helix transcriptional regulator [Paenibacillus nasutitermitis]|uniref:Transcriptional regulator n=1 Tax=Paenibacillus nasutitermitis TaxID=1652958 RepID=A0A917DML8_9BACL|nr:helix-turn-helix transcriptional regulator [Paenibacillus nasutitermitis]GGD53021.1 transcriptional regulator [Paenibacillus nasutitermitis]
MNDEQRRKELANFLKTHRARVTPQDAGLKYTAPKRRTPGLRREEVAVLSGISLPWYTSLEQGRDIQVSKQILESLVRTLKLDRDERLYLYTLANQQTPLLPVLNPGTAPPPSLQIIVDQFAECPAFFSDQRWNILAWNRVASLVFGNFRSVGKYSSNLVWQMFTTEEIRVMLVNREGVAKNLLAQFRSYYARNMEDPWYGEFIAALSERSAEFREWWTDHDVRCALTGSIEIMHPKVGRLQMEAHEFYRCEDEGTALTVYIPIPETKCQENLLKLIG